MARLTALKPRLATQTPSRVATMQDGGWRTSDMSAADRGYDHSWRKARARYLSAHPLCVMCSADGKVTPATVVDHIEPHRGDKAKFWNEANWQPLCKRCHDGTKAVQEHKAGGR